MEIVNRCVAWYHTHIGNLDQGIQVIFWGIVAVGGLAYWLWARPHLTRTQKALNLLADELLKHKSFGSARSAVEPVLAEHVILRDPWEATTRRIVPVGQAGSARLFLLGSVDDLWGPERLLHKRFNFAMFEAIPNVAVGVGLLFTFVFLSLALTDATAALAGTGAQSRSILDATQSLLSSAGGKFLSSLAGLAVSLAWTIAGRRRMARLHRASARVVEAIESLLPATGAEAVVLEQLSALHEQGRQLAAQQATLDKTHQVMLDQQSFIEELRMEAGEQTSALKRFETDLAVSIGQAISATFNPQIEQMTSRLVDAISGLSDRIGTMNQDALQKMMREFSQQISSSTQAEMDSFKETLTSLAGKLNQASQDLASGVGGAASELGRATTDMTERLAAAAQGLVDSVQGMDAAIDKTRESVRLMDSTIDRAASAGARGVGQVEQTMAVADGLVQRMGEAGRHWEVAVQTLERSAAQLADVCDGVDELSGEQRQIVSAVRAAAPEALQAVERMTGLLRETSTSTAASFNSVKDAMAGTSRDLSGVVSAISDGVSNYTQQVARLHQTMDAKMADAVGKLGGTIQNLTEAVEEFNDGLGDAVRR